MCIHKSKKKAFPVEEHEHSSAGASVQFPNTELHRAFAFRASQIRGFACGKSLRGGISVTVMVIHAGSLRRLCREGMRIWFSVRVPFKFYWRTPPWSQIEERLLAAFKQYIIRCLTLFITVNFSVLEDFFLKNESWVSEFKRQRLLHSFASHRLQLDISIKCPVFLFSPETVKLSVKYQLSKPVILGLFLVFFIFVFFIFVFYCILFHASCCGTS